MPRFVCTSTILSVLLPCLAHAQTVLTPRQVYERCRDSVVSIEVDTGKERFTGTGFFYGNGRTIATARHVLEKAKRITIRASGGNAWVPVAFTVDAASDTALLRLGADSGRKPIPHAPSDTVGVGDPVVVIGDPLGLKASLSTGVVSALRTAKGVPLVQITAAVSHGSSGGPVLDGHGRAVGIVSFMLTEGQNLNMAVSTKIAKGMVESSAFVSIEDAKTFDVSGRGKAAKVDGGAPVRLATHVGRLFDRIFKENVRWRHLWYSNLRNNDELGIKRVAEESDRFVEACGNAGEWATIRDEAIEAGATPEASDALVETFRSCAKIAYDLGMATLQSKALVNSGELERLKAANESFLLELGRQDQSMRNILRELEHVPYDLQVFEKTLSSSINVSFILLNNFHGVADVDLTGSATILDTFLWIESDLRPGDSIIGIAIEAPTPEFVSVLDWSEVWAFYQKQCDLDPASHFLLKVRRGEDDIVIEEFARRHKK